MRKAVFIDRDGTLIKDVPYNTNPDLVELEYYAGAMLQQLKKKNYLLIMVTNQQGIAKGFYTVEDFYRIQSAIRVKLLQYDVELDGVYYCPHLPGSSENAYDVDCNCRKPRPGMLLKAIEDFDIGPGNSWMIGDILNDVEAGKRAGCTTIFYNNGNETEWTFNQYRVPDFEVTNLEEATEIILKNELERV